MNKNQILSIALLLLSPLSARADYASATQRIASDLGTQQAITATQTCDLTLMTGQAGGNIGTPNQMLCLMNNLGITGATASTGVTTTASVGNQTLTMHYIVNSPGPTVDGVTYSYEMKVWTCASNCTSVSVFFPSVYVAFNTSSDQSVNNGVLVNNFGAYSGTIEGSAFIKWDVGTATTNKFFRLNMVDCSSSPATALYTYYTRTGTTATINELWSNDGSNITRTAMTWDTTAGTGNWQMDNTVSAGGDTPSWSGGFSRVASATDYTYSSASTSGSYTIGAYPTQMPGSKILTNQTVTCSGITTSNGVTTVTDGTNVLSTPMTAFGGMTLNPPNI
jgi:hypothetical protein